MRGRDRTPRSGVPEDALRRHYNGERSEQREALVAEFHRALDEHDIARGKHVLLFDRQGLGFLRPSGVTWDDVILPETLIAEIRRNVTLFLRSQQDGRPGLPSSRSILLCGPPTLLGKALSTELAGTTFLWVTPGGFDEAGDRGYFFRWARKRSRAVATAIAPSRQSPCEVGASAQDCLAAEALGEPEDAETCDRFGGPSCCAQRYD